MKIKVSPTVKNLRFLTKANSPQVVKILSAGGLVTGGVPPLKLEYLTPLPLGSSSSAWKRIQRAMLKASASGAAPQRITPWGPGFAYPFSTDKTAEGDALLTMDADFYIPSSWYGWYRIIPWPIGYTVRDAANQTRGGSIFVYISK